MGDSGLLNVTVFGSLLAASISSFVAPVSVRLATRQDKGTAEISSIPDLQIQGIQFLFNFFYWVCSSHWAKFPHLCCNRKSKKCLCLERHQGMGVGLDVAMGPAVSGVGWGGVGWRVD